MDETTQEKISGISRYETHDGMVRMLFQDGRQVHASYDGDDGVVYTCCDCGGTGQYVGLNVVEPCKGCQ